MKPILDDSELRALAADMRAYPDRLQRHVRPVVERGAANIKRDLRAQMGASRHFKGISRSIDYDVRPFGFGNRRCIGEQFAWTEAVLLLATLAPRWAPKLVPGSPIDTQAAVTLRPAHGLPMTLHRRTP